MAQRISRFKKGLIIAAAAVITIGGAGVAFAFWTAGGTGIGEATTGDDVAFDITSLGVQGDPLEPDGPAQTVAFTVTNPSEGTQRLTSVTVIVADENGDAPTGTGWDDGCLPGDFEVTVDPIPPAITLYGDILPGGAVNGVASVVLTNTTLNQDACKGLTLPLYFVAA